MIGGQGVLGYNHFTGSGKSLHSIIITLDWEGTMTRQNIPNEKLHGNKAYAWFAAGKSVSPETPKRKFMISNKKVVMGIGVMVVATITICAKLALSDANKTRRESEEKTDNV